MLKYFPLVAGYVQLLKIVFIISQINIETTTPWTLQLHIYFVFPNNVLAHPA